MARSSFTARRIAQVIWGVVALTVIVWASSRAYALDMCARAAIEIRQEVTFERQAFEARMRITNGLPNTDLADFNVELQFTDADKNPVVATQDPNNAGPLFFYRFQTGFSQPTSVTAGSTADITWLIIPSKDAGGQVPSGVKYFIGATVSYTVNGEKQTIQVTPDYIYVKPQPALQLEYFLPVTVYGDNPDTYATESSEPFPLGIRVSNNSIAPATSFRILSAQPKIKRTDSPLIEFRIESCQVQGREALPTLLADFGTIEPESSSVAMWWMTAAFTGNFYEFTATAAHADELGGEVTRLIDGAPLTHALYAIVRSDLESDDLIPDFLAWPDFTASGNLRVYRSSVTDSQDEQSTVTSLPLFGNPNSGFDISVPATTGYCLGRIAINASFPYQWTSTRAKFYVTRDDGKVLPSENAWVSRFEGNLCFHIFDTYRPFEPARTYHYYVSLASGPAGNRKPVLQTLGTRYLTEGRSFEVEVKASDADLNEILLTGSPLPAQSTFLQQSGLEGGGNAIGSFQWASPIEGTYAITFRATDGMLTDSRTMTLVVAASSEAAFDKWKERFPAAAIGDLSDSDGDGLSTLLEYATDSDPSAYSPGALPVVGTETIDGTNYLTLTYVTRALSGADTNSPGNAIDDPALQLTVVASDSLRAGATWQSLGMGEKVQDPTLPAHLERRKVKQPISGNGRQYIKLRATYARPN